MPPATLADSSCSCRRRMSSSMAGSGGAGTYRGVLPGERLTSPLASSSASASRTLAEASPALRASSDGEVVGWARRCR